MGQCEPMAITAAPLDMNLIAKGNGLSNPNMPIRHLALKGAADNWDYRAIDDDYYSQPRALFQLMTFEHKKPLYLAIPRARLAPAQDHIKLRHLRNCLQCGSGLCKRDRRFARHFDWMRCRNFTCLQATA